MTQTAMQEHSSLPEEGSLATVENAMAMPLETKSTEPLVLDASRDERSDEAALIQPGRELALTDFAPPATNTGERLIRFAYRLGISGPTLVAPFRKPTKPRLLAAVENPLSGDRAAGTALRAGHILQHGVKTPIAQIDFSPAAHLTPPFERLIHRFSWLNDLASCAPRERVTSTAERITMTWLEANPAPGKGNAWQTGHAAHRLLNWLVHAPILLSSPDRAQRARLLKHMADTARWLDRHVARADDRLDEVAAWCAITAAGLLMTDGKPRRLFGEAGLIRALGELVGDDGGVLSRSPLCQIEAIELLVRLAACYRAVRRPVPQAIDTMQALLVPPLLAMVHGDGGLGNWQGSGATEPTRLAHLIEATGIRTRPLRDVRQWGFQRVTAQRTVLLFDAAPPPHARHARSGCASTLAFELSSGPHRIIVNCGGAALAGGQIPARIEQGLRATAAHSTLALDNVNSTSVLINGKLGRGVEEVEIDRRTMELEDGSATRLDATHDGYASRYGLLHRRILILRDDGTELRGEDLLVPVGRKGKRGKISFAIRFHIGPGIEIGLDEGGTGAGLALPDGSYWHFIAPDHEIRIEESLWADGDGRPHPIQQLVIQGMVSRGGANFSWLLKKMG